MGLDAVAAKRVLESDVYRAEIEATVAQMHDRGIHSIPVLIFDVLEAAGGPS